MLKPFLLVAALYFVSRTLFVLALGDVFLYGEELEKGFVASTLLAGADVPYHLAPYHSYEGGGFVASHVKALFFVVFGTNVLAHKLAGLAWGLGVLAAVMSLLARHAGRGAALLGGLLVTFGPQHLQKESLLHLGIHYEAILFIALVLDFGLRAAAVPRGERVPSNVLIVLGLASGFGTYFSYQVPLAVLPVIAMLAFIDVRRIFSPVLVVSTILGLAPLAWMAYHVGADVVDLHGEEVGGAIDWGVLPRSLLAALTGPLGGGLALGMVAFGAISAAAGLAFLWPSGARLRAIIAVGAFVDLWIVAAMVTGLVNIDATTSHWFPLLRMAPLVAALLLLVALCAGPAWGAEGEARRSASARVVRSSAALMLGIGLVHTARIIDEGELENARTNVARLRSTLGVEGRAAVAKLGPRLLDARANGDRLPDDPQPFAHWTATIVEGLRTRHTIPDDLLVGDVVAGMTTQTPVSAGPLFDAIRRALPEASEDAIREGLGSPLFHYVARGNVRTQLLRESLHPRYAEALGRYGRYGWVDRAEGLASDLAIAAGTPRGADYLRGVGFRVFRSAVMQPYWGSELVLRPVAVRARLTLALESASDGDREAVLAGFDECARWYGLGLSAGRLEAR